MEKSRYLLHETYVVVKRDKLVFIWIGGKGMPTHCNDEDGQLTFSAL